jgi:hypothetical protein
MNLRCRSDTEGIAILQGFYGFNGEVIPECPPSPDQGRSFAAAGVTDSSVGHNHKAMMDSGDNIDHEDYDDDNNNNNNPSGSKGYSTSKSSRSGVMSNTCFSSYATEKLLSRCLGHKNCSFEITESNLGRPDACPRGTQLHLKVTYVCLPRDVLKTRHHTSSTLSPFTTFTTKGSKVNGEEDYTGFLGSPRFVPDSDSTEPSVNPSYPRAGTTTNSLSHVNPSMNPSFVSESPMTQLAKEMKRYREEGRPSSRHPTLGSREETDDRKSSSDPDFLYGQQGNQDHRVSYYNTNVNATSLVSKDSEHRWIMESINTLNFFRGESSSSP